MCGFVLFDHSYLLQMKTFVFGEMEVARDSDSDFQKEKASTIEKSSG